MKTDLTSRRIANPRRTTLSHLKDASALVRLPVDAQVRETAAGARGQAAAAEPVAAPSAVGKLPRQTANPRRTVLK